MVGNQVDNHATLWSNLQDCKISSRVEIPKLDPSVAITLRVKGQFHNVELKLTRELTMLSSTKMKLLCI